MKKYKVIVTIKYTFILDGKSKEDIKEQTNYIISRQDLLNKPYISKNLRIKAKKIFMSNV